MGYVIFRLGDTDCEAFYEGFLAQPANAISSLAYAVLGLWLVFGKQERSTSRAATVFGIGLLLVGLGSFAFHGPQGVGSRWLHDWSIAVAVTFVTVCDVALWRRWAPGRLMPVYLGAATGLGLVLAAAPEAGEWVLGLAAAALLLSEVAIYRSGVAPTSTSDRRALGVAASALALGIGLNLLGRTGGVLCLADSLLQGHAAWHLLTALAAAAFSVPFLRRIRREVPESLG